MDGGRRSALLRTVVAVGGGQSGMRRGKVAISGGGAVTGQANLGNGHRPRLTTNSRSRAENGGFDVEWQQSGYGPPGLQWELQAFVICVNAP